MKVWSIVLLSGGLWMACDGDDKPATDTADTAEVTDTVQDTVEQDTSPDVEPDTAVEDTSAPDTAGRVTWSAVHSIFANKCAPCHAGVVADDGAGGHAIASGDIDVAYEASQLDAGFAQCVGKKVGECAMTRILNGSMPQGKNCAGNPNGAGCVTAAEQQLIQDWLTDGMLR